MEKWYWGGWEERRMVLQNQSGFLRVCCRVVIGGEYCTVVTVWCRSHNFLGILGISRCYCQTLYGHCSLLTSIDGASLHHSLFLPFFFSINLFFFFLFLIIYV